MDMALAMGGGQRDCRCRLHLSQVGGRHVGLGGVIQHVNGHSLVNQSGGKSSDEALASFHSIVWVGPDKHLPQSAMPLRDCLVRALTGVDIFGSGNSSSRRGEESPLVGREGGRNVVNSARRGDLPNTQCRGGQSRYRL